MTLFLRSSDSIGSNNSCSSSNDDENKTRLLTLDELTSKLNQILERNIGIKTIHVSDKDGITILKVNSAELDPKESLIDSSVTTTFSSLVSSCNKIDAFGQTSFVMFRTNKHSVVQANYYPLVIQIVSTFEFEGETINLIPILKQLLVGVRQIAKSIFSSYNES
ncbi:hypothetical protein FG386_003374 [Cryptosporidium ryanae]|uniref:uncharacterized protein n=1 Tax=Cryptosporidium ryanae TaxID=515981 RepID=UPI00351A0D3A|nr:hypothetical protein FG386_003374 [Cryptosporidium ryanae]